MSSLAGVYILKAGKPSKKVPNNKDDSGTVFKKNISCVNSNKSLALGNV